MEYVGGNASSREDGDGDTSGMGRGEGSQAAAENRDGTWKRKKQRGKVQAASKGMGGGRRYLAWVGSYEKRPM
ncbi:hypothetical protein ACLOJK_032542 [Asimina triloba]